MRPKNPRPQKTIMKALYRFAMGLSVVALLVPAVSYAVYGGFGFSVDQANERTHDSQSSAGPILAAVENEERAQDLVSTSADLPATDDGIGVDTPPNADTSSGDEGETARPRSADDNQAPADSGGSTDTASSDGAAQPSTPTTGVPADSGAAITGDACPCTVRGSTELKGTVNLRGDLMVMGGTLVARPGVTVNGNGFQIMFMQGGRADFQGSETSTWSGKGSNANLSRDINFINLRRIIFHEGAGKSSLRYFTVKDSGTAALGDYPIHFHLNGNSTRGTLVEGVVVLNGQHHAFVPHGSHGITFRHTIAKNTRGEAYWWDPADTNCTTRDISQCTANNSNDVVYDHALADGVFNGPGDNRGFQLNAFRLGAGSGNKVINSSAINVRPSHADVCSGFHWPADANQNVGGNVWVFKNNHGQSDCNGIYVWQNDGNHHVIDGFTGGGIEHGAYGNNYDYRNVTVPFLIIHATQWKIRDSSVGVIEVRDHVAAGDVALTNVSATRVVMNDGHGEVGARLVFNGTNLECSEVEWLNPHPDSRVIIDGQGC